MKSSFASSSKRIDLLRIQRLVFLKHLSNRKHCDLRTFTIATSMTIGAYGVNGRGVVPITGIDCWRRPAHVLFTATEGAWLR